VNDRKHVIADCAPRERRRRLPFKSHVVGGLSPAPSFMTSQLPVCLHWVVHMYTVSCAHTSDPVTLGDYAFPVAAACAWNSLPLVTRACSSLLTFQRETKSHLFRQSYGWHGAVYSDGQQTSALSCATVLNLDFGKVPPQLCDGSTLIHDICSSSSSFTDWWWLHFFIILMLPEASMVRDWRHWLSHTRRPSAAVGLSYILSAISLSHRQPWNLKPLHGRCCNHSREVQWADWCNRDRCTVARLEAFLYVRTVNS